MKLRNDFNLSELTMAALQVGDDPASTVYIAQKNRFASDLGIGFEVLPLPVSATESDIISAIQDLNNSESIDGFIVQLPLPMAVNQAHILRAIDPKKDIDGLHDLPNSTPCVALAVKEMLLATKSDLRSEESGSEPLLDPKGKKAVVLGDTDDVGRPIGRMLIELGADVTFLNDTSTGVTATCKNADILVSATGVAHLVGPELVKEGAFVVDVGFSRKDGKVVGDVQTDAVAALASYISPVPGGVGPVNIACLLRNLATLSS